MDNKLTASQEDVNRIRQLKDTLQKEIGAKIMQFSKDTGLICERIYLQKISYIGRGEVAGYLVDIKVTI